MHTPSFLPFLIINHDYIMRHNHIQKTASIFVLGIDLGTSGIRGVIVEKSQKQNHLTTETIRLSESIPLHSIQSLAPLPSYFDSNTTQSPKIWIALLDVLLHKLAQSFDLSQLTQVIVDATSSTVLLCSSNGKPLTPALMYNNQQALQEAKQIQQSAGFDPETTAQCASSTLAKALFLINFSVSKKNPPPLPIICHQVDFINHYLCGCLNITDENNALKLGYDAITQTWPTWISQLLSPVILPSVVAPGTPIGLITKQHAKQYGFSSKLTIHAGTTDSIAGFLASGASQTGDAVISLGSTLAIKLISSQPVFNQQYGIYSHKLKNDWLVGGASNTGGAILLKEYCLSEIEYLIHTLDLNALSDSALKITDAYYPLSTIGERFPVADSSLAPKMPQKPKQPLRMNAISLTDLATLKMHQHYFLNIIKGLVYIEDLAYKRLARVSKQPIKRLYSVGGGEKNLVWQYCRATQFATQFNLKSATSLDAAYGVTKLITG
ncbi:Carbohydrate kinase, FGGY family [hydrothermal vent metagenome]|uniref:Carbohydrate kinase, FGGY family n=1 Tax=hydrothermal vent metagenome TaxID=652676 RepID=A0A3B0VLX8_9ZZZZ